MEFAELLNQLLIDLQSIFRKKNKELSVSFSQVIVISSIPNDGINMSLLSHRIGVDNSTLTRLIGILIKNNYVIKIKNPNDKRSVIVSLTKDGREILKKIESNVDSFSEKIYNDFPREDKIKIKDNLGALHWSISKYKLSE
ncbi:MAG: MarR family transcriptional regulator [Candidatus Neomarinimicrobiota bacterium]|nr:MarR family transcriptional regulator [Candidatus Neomarinimicrobiota bacterium]